MAKRGCTTEQIITKLREAEVRWNQGKMAAQMCKQMGQPSRLITGEGGNMEA